jgi:peptidoglycan/xylan/chitin deacetylase (PgdA/CDA1 family)
MESFLEEHAALVRGHCLEFEGADYTIRYGGERVLRADVLNLDASVPAATLIADLTKPNDLPSAEFDCILCTFVLHEIFDLDKAVSELYRTLRPGGSMLIGVPHVSMCEPRYHELWRFTVQGLTELLEGFCGKGNVAVRAYGNSLTAAGQIRGLVAEEFTRAELEQHDPRFAVLICARVTKPQTDVAVAQPIEGASESVSPRTGATGNARERPRSSPHGVILLYHRVADAPSDPYLLCVSQRRFGEHMEVLRKLGHPMLVGDLCEGLRQRKLPARALAVTFDDGYADNLLHARPLLERHEIPATFYATAGYIGTRREFWWDEVERTLFAAGRLPASLRLELAGKTYDWPLGDSAQYSEALAERHRGWNVLDERDPTPRHRLCRLLGDFLRPLPDGERQEALAQLRAQAGTSAEARPSHRALDDAELAELASSPLFEIGGHSMSHAQLSARPEEEQRREIRESKARLESILQKPLRTFAYPYGGHVDYNAASVALVREAGFLGACSNFPGSVTETSPVFELPRVMVMDWDPDELVSRLRPFLEP